MTILSRTTGCWQRGQRGATLHRQERQSMACKREVRHVPHDIGQATGTHMMATIFELNGKSQIVGARWTPVFRVEFATFPFRFRFIFARMTEKQLARNTPIDSANMERKQILHDYQRHGNGVFLLVWLEPSRWKLVEPTASRCPSLVVIEPWMESYFVLTSSSLHRQEYSWVIPSLLSTASRSLSVYNERRLLFFVFLLEDSSEYLMDDVKYASLQVPFSPLSSFASSFLFSSNDIH